MKLIIDIPEDVYIKLKADEHMIRDVVEKFGGTTSTQANLAILNGTPLVEPIQPWVYNQRTGTTGDYCSLCPTNPNNGGSGVCNCTLGTPKVTY